MNPKNTDKTPSSSQALSDTVHQLYMYSALQKYSPPLAFHLFCYIPTCNLNVFKSFFYVMDLHKIF